MDTCSESAHGSIQTASEFPPEKFTERRMLNYLHARYSQTNPGNGPRYACAEQVKNRAGFDAPRCADFIAVDCWPTGGIELHGHEVKVSRPDWLHELKDLTKSEAFRQYMHRWWLVVPDSGIVKPGELPDGWGLLTIRKFTRKCPRPSHAGGRLQAARHSQGPEAGTGAVASRNPGDADAVDGPHS